MQEGRLNASASTECCWEAKFKTRGNNTPGKPAGIEEKNFNWGIMQERNIYCISNFPTLGYYGSLFTSEKGAQMRRYWDFCLHQQRNSCSPNDSCKHITPNSFQSTQVHTEFMHSTVIPPAFPALPCHLYWLHGWSPVSGRLRMERSLAKQSCHSSCNRRKC